MSNPLEQANRELEREKKDLRTTLQECKHELEQHREKEQSDLGRLITQLRKTLPAEHHPVIDEALRCIYGQIAEIVLSNLNDKRRLLL